MAKSISYLLFFFFSAVVLSAQELHDYEYKKIPNSFNFSIADIAFKKPEVWTELNNIPEHPGIDIALTQQVKDSLLNDINNLSKAYPKDTLSTPDILYIFKPYFLYLRYIDPHYRVRPTYVYNTIGITKNINHQTRSLPFYMLNINDSLVIYKSLDPQFKPGDMVISINGDKMKDVIKYSYYHDRLTRASSLLSHYYYHSLTNKFNIELLRNNEKVAIFSEGWKSFNRITVEMSQQMATENNIRIYDGIGYISVPEFFSVNSRLIKIIRKAILSFKKQGVTEVILDFRNNPGGSGDRFDELLSMFINKETIPYLKSAKVKLSSKILADYSQSESMIGELYNLTGKELIDKVALDRTKFIGGMHYYILMNEGTGSIAASFCNVMQYNGAAVLVGEPLLHNALKYGEVVRFKRRYPTKSIPAVLRESGISTVEFEEYTKAVNDVLMPDIEIRCYAKEYLGGHDPVLEKTIKYINER